MQPPSLRWRRALGALLAAAAVGLAACTSPATASGASSSPPSTSTALPAPATGPYNPATDPVVLAVKRVEPAVVNVTTNVFESNPFGGSGLGRGVGTGFIVRSSGVVVTNFHVVEGGVRIRVTLNDSAPKAVRGKVFAARVIGGDNARDLAVLQLQGVTTPLPTVPLGNSGQAAVGERVVAIGYALALPGGPTVTSGILSSTARTVSASDPNSPNGQRTYEDALQTDAAINPGNSGGPLIDLNGNVIGINTAGNNNAQNIGFAIAIDGAKPIIEQALAHPSAAVAYLGVVTSQVAFGSAVDHGAQVEALSPGGPAEKAGIQVGDVIVTFDGKRVSGPDDLGTDIQAHHPGDQVPVQVVGSNGQTRNLTVTLGTNPLPNA
ncbi:MAG TPA: trypsin-like peptidase domain-containing protein [Actinomycetota bacterium]